MAGCKVKPAALAVATVEEALLVAGLNLGVPAMLLSGCIDDSELMVCLNEGIEPVIHSTHQVESLKRVFDARPPTGERRLWLKVNTGMNRLGLPLRQVPGIFKTLHAHPAMNPVLMSHLACADEGPSNPSVQHQTRTFARLHNGLSKELGTAVPASLAASAAVMGMPDAAYDFVRPGIMLYGASPFTDRTGIEAGLKPVMSLRSRLIAVNQVAAGESVGYGATYTCPEDSRVGVVSIGYGDGYPRTASTDTPLLVRAGGRLQRTRLLGRVSMDLLTIDLNPIPQAAVGDEVILWGDELSVDEVAAHADTIGYELLCRAGGPNARRITFQLQGE